MGPPPEIQEPKPPPPPPPEPPDKADKVDVKEEMLAVTTTDLPLNTIIGEDGGMFIMAGNENTPVHLQYARLPKPIWPKSPVTIPSSFFRDIHRRVHYNGFPRIPKYPTYPNKSRFNPFIPIPNPEICGTLDFLGKPH